MGCVAHVWEGASEGLDGRRATQKEGSVSNRRVRSGGRRAGGLFREGRRREGREGTDPRGVGSQHRCRGTGTADLWHRAQRDTRSVGSEGSVARCEGE